MLLSVRYNTNAFMLDLVSAEVFNGARKDGSLASYHCYVYDRNVERWLHT